MRAFQEKEDLPIVEQSNEYNVSMWTAMNKLNDEYDGVSQEDIGLTRNFM